MTEPAMLPMITRNAMTPLPMLTSVLRSLTSTVRSSNLLMIVSILSLDECYISTDVQGVYQFDVQFILAGNAETLIRGTVNILPEITQLTLRGGANFLVVGPDVATILESIPGYVVNTDGDSAKFAMGVSRVGSFASRFQVYKNPYMQENTILMGFRGNNFLETGAVYSPYIPLVQTPLVYDPINFTPRRGVLTRYAKKVVRPEFYGKIYVSDLDQI